MRAWNHTSAFANTADLKPSGVKLSALMIGCFLLLFSGASYSLRVFCSQFASAAFRVLPLEVIQDAWPPFLRNALKAVVHSVWTKLVNDPSDGFVVREVRVERKALNRIVS